MRTRKSTGEPIPAAKLGIAPEADLSAVPGDVDLRQELDIDSMDFLRFMVKVEERLGVSVPESDYPRANIFGARRTNCQHRAACRWA